MKSRFSVAEKEYIFLKGLNDSKGASRQTDFSLNNLRSKRPFEKIDVDLFAVKSVPKRSRNYIETPRKAAENVKKASKAGTPATPATPIVATASSAASAAVVAVRGKSEIQVLKKSLKEAIAENKKMNVELAKKDEVLTKMKQQSQSISKKEFVLSQKQMLQIQDSLKSPAAYPQTNISADIEELVKTIVSATATSVASIATSAMDKMLEVYKDSQESSRKTITDSAREIETLRKESRETAKEIRDVAKMAAEEAVSFYERGARSREQIQKTLDTKLKMDFNVQVMEKAKELTPDQLSLMSNLQFITEI